MWRASIQVDPAQAASFEFKAVLKDGAGGVIWEGGDNKAGDLAAAQGGVLALAHDFAN